MSGALNLVAGYADDGRGQDDPEEAALPLLTFELDAPPVRFDRPARDGEAQPESARVSRAAGVHAVEAVEDPLAVYRGDPRPGVLHLDRRLPQRRLRDPHADRALIRSVLDCVVEEIDQTLPEDGGIARGLDVRFGIDAQALRLFLREDPKRVGDSAGQSPEIHGFAGKLHAAGLGPRERQEALHEPRETVDLLQHAADDVAIRRSIERALERNLAHTSHGGERRAELVRRVPGESAEPREGGVEARQGGVKDRRETSEIVLGILNRKPFAERLRGDLPRPFPPGAAGPRHAAREGRAAP